MSWRVLRAIKSRTNGPNVTCVENGGVVPAMGRSITRAVVSILVHIVIMNTLEVMSTQHRLYIKNLKNV